MYAVGTFTAISWNGTTYTRNNVFSFSATKPYTVTSWDPNANGIVNSITFSPDCSTAYLGGKFTTVGGGSAKNIAAVSTIATGALDRRASPTMPAVRSRRCSTTTGTS